MVDSPDSLGAGRSTVTLLDPALAAGASVVLHPGVVTDTDGDALLSELTHQTRTGTPSLASWLTGAALLVSAAATADPSALPALEEIVVTGARNVLAQSLPLTDDTLTLSAEEQLSLDRTVADWIERLPGVSLNGQGGLFQSYSVRGFSRWRIRTEVDGIPILTDRRAGNAISFLPPALIGQVAVSRGPGSTFYGSDAMGGVVALASVAPRRLQLEARWADNDRASSLLLAGAPGPGLQAALAVRRAEDARDDSQQRLNTHYEQVAGKLAAEGTLGNLSTTVSWLPSVGRDIGKSAADFPTAAISDYPEENHSLLRVELRRDDAWLARVYHHWQDWQSDTLQLNGPEGTERNLTRYRSHTFGGLWVAPTTALGGEGRIGVEWLARRGVEIDDTVTGGGTGDIEKIRLLDAEQTIAGLFADQQWSFGDLALGAGLRWDHSRQAADHAIDDAQREAARWNGNMALQWQATERWQLAAKIGTAFRFPTLSERFFTGVTPRGSALGNPDLRPERSRGAELSTRWRGDDWQLTLSGYRNKVADYIERVRLDATTRTYANTGSAVLRGAEATLESRYAGPWQHSLSYQWQQGEDEAGEWLADLHPASLRYWLQWQGQRFTTQVDALWQWAREAAGPGELPLPESIVVNGSIGVALQPGLQTSLFVTNLFDAKALASADELAPLQPGRTVGVRFAWQP